MMKCPDMPDIDEMPFAPIVVSLIVAAADDN